MTVTETGGTQKSVPNAIGDKLPKLNGVIQSSSTDGGANATAVSTAQIDMSSKADPYSSPTAAWFLQTPIDLRVRYGDGPISKAAGLMLINTSKGITNARPGLNSNLSNAAGIADYPYFDCCAFYNQNDPQSPLLTLAGTFDAMGFVFTTPLTQAQINVWRRVQFIRTNTVPQFGGLVDTVTATRLNLLPGNSAGTNSCWYIPGSGIKTANQVPPNAGPFIADQRIPDAGNASYSTLFTAPNIFVGASDNYFGENFRLFYDPLNNPNNQTKSIVVGEYNIGAFNCPNGSVHGGGMFIGWQGSDPSANSNCFTAFGRWSIGFRAVNSSAGFVCESPQGDQYRGVNYLVSQGGDVTTRSTRVLSGLVVSTLTGVANQGGYEGWNTNGDGAGDYIFDNQRGGGSLGGHLFRTYTSTGVLEGGLRFSKVGTITSLADNVASLGSAGARFADVRAVQATFTNASIDPNGDSAFRQVKTSRGVVVQGGVLASALTGTANQAGYIGWNINSDGFGDFVFDNQRGGGSQGGHLFRTYTSAGALEGGLRFSKSGTITPLTDNVASLGATGATFSDVVAAKATLSGPIKVGVYTVATLPSSGTSGRVAYASNARVFNGTGTLEASGSGTGGLVTDTASTWRIAGTNVTASA